MGKLVNRAKMSVASAPGTGVITLGSAVAGYQTFAAAGVNDGDVVSYVIEDGTSFEYGQGTYAASGTTLTRTNIQGSTAGAGTAISASSGAMVFIATLATDVLPVGVQGGFKNLKIINGATANSQVAVTADAVSLFGALGYLTATAISLTLSTTSTGANALDTGTIAASTWYAVWIISNGTTTAGLLSTSATAPTLPSGYTYRARVGWVRTDSASNLLRTIQYGRTAQYRVTGEINNAAYPIMASGAQGNTSTPTYVAVSAAGFVPTTASRIGILLGSNGGNVALASPNASTGAYGSQTNPPPIATSGGSGVTSESPFWMTLESGSIYWASQSNTLFCFGWEDNI